jgi:hypothetical protein
MDILKEAHLLTNAERQAVYGHPADDFKKIAIMTVPIVASEIDPRLKHALYMLQVKIARLLNTPDHIEIRARKVILRTIATYVSSS